MLKKLTVLIIILVIFIGVVGILLNNKAKMAAKMDRPKTSSYAVSVTKVVKQELSDKFSLVGTVGANNDVIVVSGIQGRVTNVLVRIGDYVEAGANLVEIFDDLGKISSPISGVVTDLPVTIGMMLNPGTVVANVIDIATLKLKLNVGEVDVFKLKLGDPVIIETEIYPGVLFNGRIESISQKGDDAHTYPVKVNFANSKQHPLKAGMFAQATFQSNRTHIGVVVSRDALVEENLDNPQVYVVESGVAKLRNLVLGPEVGTNIVVQDGLAEGEILVIKGQTNLMDGAEVNIIK